MAKSKVSIVKTLQAPNYEQIFAAVQKALDLLGGIRDIIKPGQKVQVVQYEDRVELIPLKPIRQTRGFLKGIKTQIQREADRL